MPIPGPQCIVSGPHSGTCRFGRQDGQCIFFMDSFPPLNQNAHIPRNLLLLYEPNKLFLYTHNHFNPQFCLYLSALPLTHKSAALERQLYRTTAEPKKLLAARACQTNSTVNERTPDNKSERSETSAKEESYFTSFINYLYKT